VCDVADAGRADRPGADTAQIRLGHPAVDLHVGAACGRDVGARECKLLAVRERELIAELAAQNTRRVVGAAFQPPGALPVRDVHGSRLELGSGSCARLAGG
jgi:hypothetical protein